MQKGATLPYDFVTLVGMNDLQCGRPLTVVPSTETPKFDEYKIVGSKIYSGVPDFTVHYRKRLEEVESVNDEIDLPIVFESLVQFCFCSFEQQQRRNAKRYRRSGSEHCADASLFSCEDSYAVYGVKEEVC